MRKVDDIVAVKKVALDLLGMDVKPTKIAHRVDHPIFEGPTYIILPNGPTDFSSMITYDLFSPEGVKAAREDKKRDIEACTSVADFMNGIIQKAYWVMFFNLIKDFLSQKTFSEWLGILWVESENPNSDIVVTTDMLLEWFRMADRECLMKKGELKIYKGLPDEVRVYRGVGKKSNPHGLSWTLDLEQAKWFANRYDTRKTGYVLTAFAKKEDILAYFETEKEVIVDVSKLDIQKIEN